MYCQSLARATFLWTLVIVATGCSSEKEGDTVTGSVTQGGTGVADVLVVFGPRGDGIPKGARTDANGKFSLKLLPGKYTVVLSKKVNQQGNVPGPDEDVEDLEASGLLRESVPAQYSNPAAPQLSADIPAGGTDLEPFVIEGN